MSLWVVIAAAIALIAATLAAAFAFLGPERIWSLYGPADLGPVSFETLQRRKKPNDALAAPADLTRARIDVYPPVFAVDAAALRRALGRAIASERRLTLVAIDDAVPAERYVQRSERMRFPDTIIVRFLDRPGGRSTLAIYSRSQLGGNDLGVNLARINRWLDKLAKEVPPVAE
ncbi:MULTISPECIES: DUF1499 domain-containing protein [Rhodomicrobium]|uniref:DUF1499 domain-containing protein n=1 Tax=Rhodomicrobium TaxID=1068 RepID=UPI0014827356|nr:MULTISPECIES: DUF1499 domain-containing protein [Rhodomicrobium]